MTGKLRNTAQPENIRAKGSRDKQMVWWAETRTWLVLYGSPYPFLKSQIPEAVKQKAGTMAERSIKSIRLLYLSSGEIVSLKYSD